MLVHRRAALDVDVGEGAALELELPDVPVAATAGVFDGGGLFIWSPGVLAPAGVAPPAVGFCISIPGTFS